MEAPRPDLKMGEAVRIKGWPVTYWVSEYNGKKCLRYPDVMGWRHAEPNNWEDVELLNPPTTKI